MSDDLEIHDLEWRRAYGFALSKFGDCETVANHQIALHYFVNDDSGYFRLDDGENSVAVYLPLRWQVRSLCEALGLKPSTK